MTFVILKHIGENFTWMVKATGDKHFELCDKGYDEVASGTYYEMRELDRKMNWPHLKDCLWLRSLKTGFLCYTTDDCLSRLLDLYPMWLEDYEFVADMTLDKFLKEY